MTAVDEEYRASLEQELATLRERIENIARCAGRLQSVLECSRDHGDTVTEVRGIAGDLYDAIGATPCAGGHHG